MGAGNITDLIVSSLSAGNTAQDVAISLATVDPSYPMVVAVGMENGHANLDVTLTDADTGFVIHSPTAIPDAFYCFYFSPDLLPSIPLRFNDVTMAINRDTAPGEYKLRPNRLRIQVGAAGVGLRTRVSIFGRRHP